MGIKIGRDVLSVGTEKTILSYTGYMFPTLRITIMDWSMNSVSSTYLVCVQGSSVVKRPISDLSSINIDDYVDWILKTDSGNGIVTIKSKKTCLINYQVIGG